MRKIKKNFFHFNVKMTWHFKFFLIYFMKKFRDKNMRFEITKRIWKFKLFAQINKVERYKTCCGREWETCLNFRHASCFMLFYIGQILSTQIGFKSEIIFSCMMQTIENEFSMYVIGVVLALISKLAPGVATQTWRSQVHLIRCVESKEKINRRYKLLCFSFKCKYDWYLQLTRLLVWFIAFTTYSTSQHVVHSCKWRFKKTLSIQIKRQHSHDLHLLWNRKRCDNDSVCTNQ